MILSVRRISTDDHLGFVRERSSVSFLQTPAWAKVKQEWRSESVGWFDGTTLVGAALVLHRPVPKLKRATLAYVPEGPAIDWSGPITDWLDPFSAYLRANGAFAVRLGPPVRTATWDAAAVKEGVADDSVARLTQIAPTERFPTGARVVSQLRADGWLLQSPEDGFGSGQPQYTYEIPLIAADGSPLSEADVLKGMNQLWRRNIKRADKEGVQVEIVRGVPTEEQLVAFHELYVHTAERDHFTPRPLSYFRTMFGALAVEDPERISLFTARHEGDLVAATILVRVGTHAWYSYGASSTQKRDVRGSNALQWAMIRDSLAAGCEVYDLRGITPTLDSADSHVGLIQFKVGTGGRAVEYVGEWDKPLKGLLYRAFTLYMNRRGR